MYMPNPQHILKSTTDNILIIRFSKSFLYVVATGYVVIDGKRQPPFIKN